MNRRPQVFVSYRRDDSEFAATEIQARLADRLGRENVHFDREIPPGTEFRDYLEDRVSRCDVLLALMGVHWLNVRSRSGPREGQRRLEDEDDFVRWEILAALSRGTPVIPVLLGRADLPRKEELPPTLGKLIDRQAIRVSPGADFATHVDRLVAAVEGVGRTAWQAPRSRRIFLCHTRRDARIAMAIRSSLRATGDTFLDPLATSRPGEYRSERARWLIEEADVFVLLWSTSLNSSPYCEEEWRYALSLERERFVRPCYWQEPLPLPPEELIELHFRHLPLQRPGPGSQA